MSTNSSEEKRKWRDRIKDHYRLVVLNDETLQEVSSYKLNLLNLYILLSTMVVLVGLMVFAIIVYTPIKKIIPGYGDVNATPQFIELKEKTKNLEIELNAIQTYIDANKNRLMGNSTTTGTNVLIEQAYAAQQIELPDTVNTEESLESNSPIVAKKKIRFFNPPIRGIISAEHDKDDNHYGIDILAPKGSPISAILEGSVISSEYNIETGNTISIQHENNIVSTYKHNSVLLKKVGDYVKSGEAIAIVGNSGIRTDGPHLHFELWIEGQSIDPAEYINFSE